MTLFRVDFPHGSCRYLWAADREHAVELLSSEHADIDPDWLSEPESVQLESADRPFIDLDSDGKLSRVGLPEHWVHAIILGGE